MKYPIDTVRTRVQIQPVLHLVDFFEESTEYDRRWKLPFNSLSLSVREDPCDPSWIELPEKGCRFFYEKDVAHFTTLETPLQIMPYYTGFRMSMKIRVAEHFSSRQTIFSSGPNGASLWIRNGKLQAVCFSDQDYFASEKGSLYASFPKALEPGKWHSVTFERDGKEFWLSVDGVKGKATPFCGSILRHMAGCLGMGIEADSGFSGKIADFRIEVGK